MEAQGARFSFECSGDHECRQMLGQPTQSAQCRIRKLTTVEALGRIEMPGVVYRWQTKARVIPLPEVNFCLRRCFLHNRRRPISRANVASGGLGMPQLGQKEPIERRLQGLDKSLLTSSKDFVR